LLVTGSKFNPTLRFLNAENPWHLDASITRLDAPVGDGLAGKHDGLSLRLIRREAQTKNWVSGITDMEFEHVAEGAIDLGH
jgi:hypothetical protein